jgi:hypothetical protein
VGSLFVRELAADTAFDLGGDGMGAAGERGSVIGERDEDDAAVIG